ncbi:MAG: hypothetical protein UV48_C0001G0004 [Candidatus Azambacteria bacterium GW2011_GWA2_42_9]|uniref:DUF4015 domain-containing protein n=1 Tax=Candidatus Azambacteria bacterium GW2011_GWA2_42_9 TaxID=1618613 RepID=A0A0G1BS05_9BACT|nr:MAG: hypothetical protein UV48_C0001G0004 [Candidatus Azambacteria bacterium GW2011_GWA2_42_9]
MKLYSFSILFLLIVVLTGGTYFTGSFYFLKKITASVLSFSNDLVNRFLIIRPIEVKNRNHLKFESQFGVYSTVWSARSKRINDLIRLADKTEINSIVIDVKDSGVYIDDYLKGLIEELHKRNIYTIARLVVFQDNSQIKIHPGWYFKKADGTLWRDNRGWYWMDPTNLEVWDYNLAAAKKTVDVGFDELNFENSR